MPKDKRRCPRLVGGVPFGVAVGTFVFCAALYGAYFGWAIYTLQKWSDSDCLCECFAGGRQLGPASIQKIYIALSLVLVLLTLVASFVVGAYVLAKSHIWTLLTFLLDAILLGMFFWGADLYVTQPCLVYFLNVTLVMWIVHIALLIALINCWVRLRRGRPLFECSQPTSTAKRKRAQTVKPQPQPQTGSSGNSGLGVVAAQPTQTHMLASSNSHNLATPVGSSRLILTPGTADGDRDRNGGGLRTPLAAASSQQSLANLVQSGKQQFVVSGSGAGVDFQWTSERALQLQREREALASSSGGGGVVSEAAVSPAGVLMHGASPLAASSRAQPQHALVRSSSGAGGQHVYLKPAAFVPPPPESKQDGGGAGSPSNASSAAAATALSGGGLRARHTNMEDSTEFPSLPEADAAALAAAPAVVFHHGN